MKLFAAVLLAVAFPGSALGAGLVEQRDLRPQAPSVLSPGAFELVGLHWRGPGVVKYRTRSLGGRWSAWRRSADEDALPNRGREARATRGWRIGDPVWTGASNRIQYRAIGRVTRVRAYFVRSPRLPVTVKRAEIAGSPPIITRAGWRADESIRRGAPYYADGVHLAIVHHTAGSNSYTKGQSASIVRAIELYHVQGNGWNDIGYNFLVDKYGQIFEGRYGGMTKPVVGAHAMGFNTGSVGISVIGDYGSTAISPAARAALVSLIAWRLDFAHVDPLSSVVRISAGNPRYPPGRAVTLKAISGHRDVYPTSCPGASLYSQLPAIRTAVSRTGLPKLYSPAVTGALGGPVRFTGRLSGAVTWTVTVRDATGGVAASGTGTGARVDWTWDASAAPTGRYTWAISAPQMRSATGAIGTAPVPLSLQQLRVAPTIVSPNGDGRGDEAKVSYRLSTGATVTAIVQDVLDHTVATLFSGPRTAGKQDLTWSPDAVADGWYRLKLTASAGGKQAQTSTRFWVDRTLGASAASSPAFSPNGDGRLDTVRLSFSLLNPAHVEVRVLRNHAIVATLLQQDLTPGSQRLSWDGGGFPNGRYTVAVSAVDSLLTVTQAVPVRIDRKPPSLRLVSLASLTFRVGEPGRLVLAVNGRWRQVAVRRAGLVHVRYRGTVRGLTAYAVDLAGNKGRTVKARR
jgi:N-acetylmuramoyl-L-alanine amidase-like protein